MSTKASQWLAAFAQSLGVEAPNPSECDEILALAGVAAHASERTAAPVACWLAAKIGLSPREALELAEHIVALDSDSTEGAPGGS